MSKNIMQIAKRVRSAADYDDSDAFDADLAGVVKHTKALRRLLNKPEFVQWCKDTDHVAGPKNGSAVKLAADLKLKFKAFSDAQEAFEEHMLEVA